MCKALQRSQPDKLVNWQHSDARRGKPGKPSTILATTWNFVGQVEKSPQVKLSICPMKLMRTGFKCLLDNLSCLLANCMGWLVGC